jgi:hypothetical protein
MMLCRWALATVVLLASASWAEAQARLRPGDLSLGAWIGGSANSPLVWGDTRGRRLLLLGGRAEWVIEALEPYVMVATADFVPVALVTDNPTYRVESTPDDNGSLREEIVETGKEPVFGAGVTPLGLKIYLTAARKVRLYGAGALGALLFTRNTPTPDARRLNVVVEVGAGLEMERSARQSIVLGYKFHHLSNARSQNNPGIDSNVIYLGFLQRR